MTEVSETPEFSNDGRPLEAVIHLGELGASETVEVTGVSMFTSPEGRIGILARDLGRIIPGTSEETVVWMDVPEDLKHSHDPLEFVGGKVVVDPEKAAVFVDDVELPLGPREFQILSYLAINRGRVVSTEELMEEIWDGHVVSTNLRIHISGIRRKLGKYSWIIQTKYGTGFILDDSSPPANN